MYTIFDGDHYQTLLDEVPTLKPAEYLYLKTVANMQRLKKYGYWCVMSNADFCSYLNYNDSGLRKMQKKLEQHGLLEFGRGSKKRATDKFLKGIVKASPQSSDSDKVADNSPQSSGQTRHKVADNSPQSSDNNKNNKEIIKDKQTELPFSSSSFQNSWNEWLQYRKQIKKKMTSITTKRQLGKLAKYKEGEAVAMIEQSMEKGWSGLFEVKDNKVDWKALNDTGL